MQITHCPTCATSFEVTPDQLKLANGWVRCGRCACVFEALLHVTPPAAFSDAASVSAPKRRGLWLFLSASLLLLLMAQAVWMGRHLVFAQIPVLRPALFAVCASFPCEATWPRAPDAVSIESSTFSETLGGGYSVQLRLKNTENYPVATPSLELTLLDLQDQVVVRRVFTREELGLDDHLLVRRDVHAHVDFDLETAASQRITGFRALVFYP